MELRRIDTTRAAHSPAEGARSPAASWLTSALLAAALGLLAILPRTLGLADYLTTDEAYHWITRVERFSAALSERRWADTVLTGHPGVTNMWLGSLGLWLERTLLGAGLIAPPTLVEHLAWLRLPGATLQALLVPAAYLLLRRLIPHTTALVAAVLWATSPYLIAHGRLLHLDALLTSFVTFSLLLLLCPSDSRRLVLSGVFAGLALLTKGPALILLPFAGLLIACQAAVGLTCGSRPTGRAWLHALLQTAGRYALWLAAAALTVLTLWPALWAEPARAIGRYVGEIVSNGGRPNGDGQFFLGGAVDDPGALFYMLANLFRTTPLMLLGLLTYAGFGIWNLRSVRRSNIQHLKHDTHHQTLLVLLAFVVFWTLVMTLGPKKFDRYVLPTWPALCVLAAAGLTHLWRAISSRLIDHRSQSHIPNLTALALLLAAELWQPLSVHPYYLSYYNPLLGGGRAAERTFLIGWGEGMDQVGAWLSQRPDIAYGPVLSALGRTLQPFVPVDVRDVEDYGRVPANYAVVYLESLQRAANPPIYEAIQRTVPLHTVTINGIEYARIFQLPRPFERPLEAQFGEGLRLRGVTLAREPGRLVLTPAWDVHAPAGGDFLAFVHLIDARGQRVAQLAVPPGGGDAPPTGAWQPGQQIAVPLPLDLPPDLPPGQYTLTLGLFDPATGARVPLTIGTTADPHVAGDNALLVETVTLNAER
ncbi:MAG: hypothetical protein RLZZ387_4633 [Chloroflexota bacterium]|jgi:hypothetical protein